MKKLLVLGMVLVFLTSVVAVAQYNKQTTSNLAKIIVINREDIKIGKTDQHEGLVRALRTAVNNSDAKFNWIAATSLSGNTGEQNYFVGYDSYAAMEHGQQALAQAYKATLTSAERRTDNTETHLNWKGTIARLREDLSYNPERIDIAQARAWKMTTVRLKPGTTTDFTEYEQSVLDLHRRNNIDEAWAVYEVEFGANTPTFLLFTPYKSLSDLDNTELKAVHERVFTSAVKRQLSAAMHDAILTQENTLLSVAPEISNPEPATVAANPTFWTVKEPDQTQVATSREKGRKNPVEPAIQKKDKK